MHMFSVAIITIKEYSWGLARYTLPYSLCIVAMLMLDTYYESFALTVEYYIRESAKDMYRYLVYHIILIWI